MTPFIYILKCFENVLFLCWSRTVFFDPNILNIVIPTTTLVIPWLYGALGPV